MKLIIATLALGIFSMPAFAQYARYPYISTSVSCNEIQSAIHDHGALVIYRSRHLYDVYVKSRHYCQGHQEMAVLTSIPTADGKCRVRKCAPNHNR